MKKLFICAALAAASVATPVSAATCVSLTAGSNPTSCYFNYTPNSGGSFGNTDPLRYTGPGTHFQDVFSFVTNFTRAADISIFSEYPGGNGVPIDFSKNVNFISNGVRINGTLIPAVRVGQFEERTLLNFRIPEGISNNQIVVRGSSGVNGMYNGILSLSGVPEPSTWAMMIVGIGFAGAALRRRRQTTRIAYA